MVGSYYAASLAGNPTASGDVCRPQRYTAPHKKLPLGTDLEISYRGESVRVTVNDRGPHVSGHDLGLVRSGVAPVLVTVR